MLSFDTIEKWDTLLTLCMLGNSAAYRFTVYIGNRFITFDIYKDFSLSLSDVVFILLINASRINFMLS